MWKLAEYIYLSLLPINLSKNVHISRGNRMKELKYSTLTKVEMEIIDV
jgi:hypothetical protein